MVLGPQIFTVANARAHDAQKMHCSPPSPHGRTAMDDQFAADIAAQRARQMNAELPDATRDMLKLKGMI